MKIGHYSVCFLIFNLLLVPFAFAQERALRLADNDPQAPIKQALVIGNSSYAHTSPLRNPVNDAQAVSKTLRELGFAVTTLLDTDQRTMEATIASLGESLKESKGIGLFYYAGHGMQVDGENYMFPIDINPRTEADVRFDAVPVGKLLGQMASAQNAMNLVILDACRNNPFARSFRAANQGLAQVIAPSGAFISYATAPGQVAADGEGDNGLFTSKLLKHMKTPGLKLEEVFKLVRIDVQQESSNQQVPWDSSSLTGDFYFSPEVSAPPGYEDTDLIGFQSAYEVGELNRIQQQRVLGQWQDWQQKMQSGYEEATGMDEKDTAIEKKITAWKDFLETWKVENPFSEEDEKLRSNGVARLQFWQEEKERVEAEKQAILQQQREKERWVDFQERMQNEFAKNTILENEEVEAGKKIDAWQAFLDSWTMDNPHSQADTELRSQARIQLHKWRQAQVEEDQASKLGQIAILLQKGQWSIAGERLSEYNSFDGQAEISDFFPRQSADAQYELAQIYRKGIGLDKDLRKALRWYKTAAENQYPKAQTMLGYLYQTGTGTSVDLSTALDWYQKAADQEEPMALYNLGSLYLQGKGVTKNENRAKNLFTQAAAKGNRQAQQMLENLGD